MYAKPSDLVKALVLALPSKSKLNEDQSIFIERFAQVLDTVYDQERTLDAEQRNVYHTLLLGQGGSGKTHIVQNIVFPVVEFIWPAGEQSTLMVVAAKNAQAKNISTDTVRAKTLHSASLLGVQSLTNSNMAAGSKEQALQKLWSQIRVLVIEEISMVSALLYNMLDFRSMLGRRSMFGVDINNYTKTGCAFGRIPIILHLGDFFQLRPTAQVSLLDDLHEQDKETGKYKYVEVPAEVQHAQRLFAKIPDVFELRGTMRFKPGDPLIELLQCMREGRSMPDVVWEKLQARAVAKTTSGQHDQRFDTPHFRRGYCMSIYWASLVRMMYRRALTDAHELDQPLVLLQAADTALGLDKAVALRFLNRPNPYQTGHMHGLFPCHAGMRIRFVAKLDAEKGMVQDTQATIIDFEFHDADRARYRQCKGGELFSPKFLPAGLWVAVDGYQGCPKSEALLKMCRSHVTDEQAAERLARSVWFLPAEETKIQLSSSEKYEVRRCGFRITHANFFTSTASQGLTLRSGTIIDCARMPEMNDENWWLHLYVMFSRVTALEDMLLLRPPPRHILELGPPATIRAKVSEFLERAERCRAGMNSRRSKLD